MAATRRAPGLRRPALALLLALALPLAAPAQDNGAPAPQPVATEDVLPDGAIAERMRAIVRAFGVEDVEVAVEAGIVTLSGTVAEPALSDELAGIAARVEGVVAVQNQLRATTEISEQLDPIFSRFGARIDQGLALLPLLLIAVLIFVTVFWLGVVVSRLGVWTRAAPNAFIAGIYRQAVRAAFGIGALVVALELLGAGALIGTILGAAGIVGLAVGFAVRDTVENFVASIMLSLRQPFRPNDLVEIAGDTGRVIRLSSRATILLSLDGNHIRIPNAVVFKSRIVNFTRHPSRRFTFDVGIDPDAPIEKTRILVQDTLRALPFVLETPDALVWVENLTEGGVILRVTGWLDQDEAGFVTARGDAIRIVKAAIEGAGVSIPDTTYRIRVEGAGVLADAAAPRPPTPAEMADTPPPEAEPAAASFRASEENAVVAIVDAERVGEDDLLRANAPQE
ncbi:MAG: mechanosensitive ion channel domain-containing protein [Pseudomonadota bacterium]